MRLALFRAPGFGMPTDFAFRLSTYLTLGLACVCLGYAEWELLTEVTVFTGVVCVLLAVAFRSGFELSLSQANRLGLAIFLLIGLWIGWQFVRPSGGLIYSLPWPASLLPYLGPLLMVLMPAKLLRPKHVGDWWALQGVGLVTVALASALVDDAVFGTLVVLYASVGIWSLCLFYFHRAAGIVPPVPGKPGPRLAGVVASGPARGYLARSTLWAAMAAAIGLPIFFLTPRSGAPRWQFGKQLESGQSGELTVDLNRTGDLTITQDVVFEVDARYATGEPKDDLSGVTRWRTNAYGTYESGRWSPVGTLRLFRIPDAATRPRPEFGGGEFTLQYHPTAKLIRPAVAQPVRWSPGEPVPIATLGRLPTPWTCKSDGSFIPFGSIDGRVRAYWQLSAPSSEPDLGPGFDLDRRPGDGRSDDAIAALKRVGLRRLRAWAVDLLRELVAEGRISPDVLARADDRINLQVDPRDAETVGHAFRDFFAGSGRYRYDLKLRREDSSLDPIEDFLFNTRAGHCERFASALALSLRAVGVPAQFVLGFKGNEIVGSGRYAVREEHAHAWVEILIPRTTPDGSTRWHWLALDSTPDYGGEAIAADGPQTWLGSARSTGEQFFQDYIVGYNAERHRRAVAAVREELTANAVYLAIGVACGIAVAFLPRGRRWLAERRALAARAAGATGVPWYDAFLAAARRVGWKPAPGVTPREFATQVAETLRSRPELAAFAEVPTAVSEAFYDTRYAGRPITADAAAELQDRVARFAAALREERKPT